MAQTKKGEERELKYLVKMVKRMLKGWRERMRIMMGEKDYMEEFYKETVELVERTGDRDDCDNKEKRENYMECCRGDE